MNLPSTSSVPTNLARTKVAITGETWDFHIWQAFKENLRARLIAEALMRKPSDRFFRLGWLSSVFRLNPAVLLELVPESKRPTVWLASGGKVEISEGGLERAERVPLAPEAMADVVRLATVLHFCAKQAVVPGSFEWKGPRSLIPNVRDGRSSPLQNGFHLPAAWAAKCLVSESLQFLKPPNGVREMLPQTVALSTSVAEVDKYVQMAIIRGTDPRKALLNCPQILVVLELAKSRPEELQPADRALLKKVFPTMPGEMPAALPIRFAKPFDVFAATRQGDINLAHPFGQDFCKALGAIALAEQTQKINHKQVQKLEVGCMHHTIVGQELVTSYDVFTVVARAFALVVNNELISNFVPPPRPNETELVPYFSAENLPDKVGPAGKYIPTVPIGEVGALLESVPR